MTHFSLYMRQMKDTHPVATLMTFTVQQLYWGIVSIALGAVPNDQRMFSTTKMAQMVN